MTETRLRQHSAEADRSLRYVLAGIALLIACIVTSRIAWAAAISTGEVVPVHGTILANQSRGRAVFANDEVVGMLTAATRTYRLDPTTQHFAADTSVDAFIDRSTHPWRLFDVHAAQTFVAGLPNKAITHLLGVGDAVPTYPLVDQRGRLVSLDSFRGKVTLLSFVYTRCPPGDLCPLISGKYETLARRLDPRVFHLVEVTLDPRFDSPFILAHYGARFGADPRHWSLLTGQPSQVKDLLDQFGISSVQDGPAHYVHDDQLVIVGKSGTIRTVIPTGSWSPDQVIATARSVAGLGSNPFERFELAAFGSFVAFCGGSVSTALVILDSSVILGGMVVFGALLAWFGHRIFAHE